MRELGLLLVLIVGALPAAAITWGQPDTEHTNVGGLMISVPGVGLYPTCSGTLVHERVFLTAGHCTESVKERLSDGRVEAVYVSFDQDVTASDVELLEVAEIITHPDYNWGPTSNPYDVGALTLAEPVTDIEPATLPTEGFLDNLREEGKLNQGKEKAKFTLVGYGGTLDWPPPDIYYEDQRQYAVSEYRALLKAWLRMSQNQATGDGGTCYGDSGGPAFWEPDDETRVLVGITSWGDAVCVASAFNYRVDIPETLDFIDYVIDNLP
jgi:hypothetical protein